MSLPINSVAGGIASSDTTTNVAGPSTTLPSTSDFESEFTTFSQFVPITLTAPTPAPAPQPAPALTPAPAPQPVLSLDPTPARQPAPGSAPQSTNTSPVDAPPAPQQFFVAVPQQQPVAGPSTFSPVDAPQQVTFAPAPTLAPAPAPRQVVFAQNPFSDSTSQPQPQPQFAAPQQFQAPAATPPPARALQQFVSIPQPQLGQGPNPFADPAQPIYFQLAPVSIPQPQPAFAQNPFADPASRNASDNASMISGLTMVDDFTGGGGGGGGKVEGGKFERGTQPQDTLPVVPFQSTSAAALEAGQANEKPEFANTIVRVRSAIRAPAGEALGSMILVLFGLSVQCQVMLSKNPGVAPAQAGEFLSIGFGWGTGLALGVWLTGGASGGHISPVVTIAMAIFRGFSWRRVPVYILAQLFGAWFGAIIVYANYFHAIDIVEGGQGVRTIAGTAGLFALYTPEYVPAANAFFNEFLCSFLLMIAVFSVTDNSGGALPLGLAPMILFIVVLTISQGFGLQTGAGISPARDLGPRIMTSMVGYGQDVFNYRDQFWLWCMQAGPLAGGLIGAIVYDLLIFVGPQSPFNKPFRRMRMNPMTLLRRDA